MQLKTGSHVLVCDAGKALILENRGDTDIIDLRVVEALSQENPRARAQADDRPGRYLTPDGGRTAIEATDRHEAREGTFIEQIAERLKKAVEKADRSDVVVIADPRSLGRLRAHLRDATAFSILAEISADLAHAPVPEIEAAVRKFAKP